MIFSDKSIEKIKKGINDFTDFKVLENILGGKITIYGFKVKVSDKDWFWTNLEYILVIVIEKNNKKIRFATSREFFDDMKEFELDLCLRYGIKGADEKAIKECSQICLF